MHNTSSDTTSFEEVAATKLKRTRSSWKRKISAAAATVLITEEESDEKLANNEKIKLELLALSKNRKSQELCMMTKGKKNLSNVYRYLQ
ncbi:hypothetical protein HK100_008799, partial [Physocladia obscura]